MRLIGLAVVLSMGLTISQSVLVRANEIVQ
jgi:hypothetical protein